MTAFEPMYRSRPPERWTNGDLAAKVGADLGLTPDTEQAWLLDAIYAEKAARVPASFEVGVVAPRQNLKSATLEVAALADLFVFEVPLGIWTAHLLSTAQKAFQDMRNRIMAHAEYDDQVDFYEGHQDMSITTKDRSRALEFYARSGKAGRGFSCDRLTLDEGLYLRPTDLGAIVPTLVTRKGAQIRHASSAGLQASSALRTIRNRGRSGKDRSLAYVEYGAERKACADSRCSHVPTKVEGCALDDRELWWAANCALWAGRITEEAMENQRGALADDPMEFAREFLTWWDDPVSEGGAVDYPRWLEQADPGAARGDVVAFGVDVADDRLTSIGVAFEREDGGTQGMLSQDADGRPDVGLSPSAAVERLVELYGKWGGTVALGGPALEALGEKLENAGVDVTPTTMTEFGGGCGEIVDGLRERTFWHGSQEELSRSIRGAKWRSIGTAGEKAFQLKDADGISPAAAVARAVHGLSTVGGVILW